MSRESFRNYSIFLTLLMAVFIFSFGFILISVVKATQCQAVGGACGALAVVAGLYLRLLGAFIYGVVMLVLIARRCSKAGLSLLWLLPCLLWLIGARDFLIAGNNFWGVGFSMGILVPKLPMTLLFFLGFVVFLWFYEKEYDDDGASRPAWRIALWSIIPALLLSLPSILPAFLLIGGIGAVKPVMAILSLFSPIFMLHASIGPVAITSGTILLALFFFHAYGLWRVIHGQRQPAGSLARPRPVLVMRGDGPMFGKGNRR